MHGLLMLRSMATIRLMRPRALFALGCVSIPASKCSSLALQGVSKDVHTFCSVPFLLFVGQGHHGHPGVVLLVSVLKGFVALLV